MFIQMRLFNQTLLKLLFKIVGLIVAEYLHGYLATIGNICGYSATIGKNKDLKLFLYFFHVT